MDLGVGGSAGFGRHTVAMTNAGSPGEPDSNDIAPQASDAVSRRLTALPAISVGFFATAAVFWVVSLFVFFSNVSSVAQPVATVLGGAAVFGAGLVTFKSARDSRVSAAQTAADALSHSQSVAAAERVRFEEQLASQREQSEKSLAEQSRATELTHSRELVRDLRARYTTAAEQLAHASAAIRLAGVYALASLADDWQLQGERDEKQVAIDLLRAYLRTPNVPVSPEGMKPFVFDPGEVEVRHSIVSNTLKHAKLEVDDRKSWQGFDCSFEGADLRGLSFADVDLTGVDLTGANLTGAFLTNANLTGATLYATHLSNANLVGANLTGADLFSAYLVGARVSAADLTDANLQAATLTRTILTGGNLTNANLTGALLTDANLTAADLTGANLLGADLSGADLTNANLLRANLTRTNLTDTNFFAANFFAANLTSANLTGADLTAANLPGANLTSANLTRTNLTRTNLTRTNLDDTDVAGIIFGDPPRWPEGFAPHPST